VASILGVDVSLGRGHDVVLLEDATVKETWSAVGKDGLRRLLEELQPAAVGIDAPSRPGLGLLREEAERAKLTVPPVPGKHLARRVAEYELSRRGIGSHQTHYDETRLFSWMTAGFEAFDAARRAGYPTYPMDAVAAQHAAFEVFPYASYVTLAGCISPGRKFRLEWRRQVLAEAGVRGVPEDASIDTVDATCAALTAERFLQGRGSALGDPREGVVVLPVAVAAEHYRRCAPPGGRPVHAAEKPLRLCECGCGTTVRSRFVPGHAARLKAHLTEQVRVGDHARTELLRLGWTRPKE
jgi:predicted nuclease with RNAse H fold